jgi:UDP-N-acetylmuramate--alanine ligase
LLTVALQAAGADPAYAIGGDLTATGTNAADGAGDLFVVEADEYDRSFLALTPTVAVVTNVEADHLDIYADLADIRATFARFVAPARYIVLCADDVGANTLPTPSTAEVIRYGVTSPDARLVGVVSPGVDGGSQLRVVFDGEELGTVQLQVPGTHNVRNALAAIGSGLALGAKLDQMRPGLEAFGGVERRFQRLGTAAGVLVVDDYAHHPTEIEATLSAARSAYPDRRIVVAFQPHLYSRTRDFAVEFGRALAASDAVFLTEIYPAREQPLPGVTASLVEAEVRAASGAMAWRGERAGLAEALAAFVQPGDVVLTVGAGDVTKTGPELLGRLGGAR